MSFEDDDFDGNLGFSYESGPRYPRSRATLTALLEKNGGLVSLERGAGEWANEERIRAAENDASCPQLTYLLSQLRDRVPARLLKVQPPDEWGESRSTMDLKAIGRLAGFDSFEQLSFELPLSPLSYRETLSAQPDDVSRMAFAAAYRRFQRTGKERIAWALAPYLADDSSQSAIERARWTLGYGSDSAKLTAKPGPSAKKFFAVKFTVKAPPMANLSLLFAKRHPKEASATGWQQCEKCYKFYNRGAAMSNHRRSHEKPPE